MEKLCVEILKVVRFLLSNKNSWFNIRSKALSKETNDVKKLRLCFIRAIDNDLSLIHI